MVSPYRDRPVRFNEAIADITADDLPFDLFNTWLDPLGISARNASAWFQKDYWDAWTQYTGSWIMGIFHEVSVKYKKKYDKLIAIYQAQYDPISNYDRTEEIETIRTPDLTKASSGSATTNTEASSEGTMKNNQTRTTTESGGDFQAVDTRSVVPYDQSTFSDAERHTTSASGSRTTGEAWSGQPDKSTSSTTSEATATDSRTETETGTDTTTHEAHIYGNIGVTSSQELARQEQELADRMNIWKVIETDLARDLFLQVW